MTGSDPDEEEPPPTVPLDEAPTVAGGDTAPEARLFADRYRQLRLLGEGGFGKVWLVADTLHDGELLALKLILPERQTEEFERRFRNEIRVLRALQHEGIPQIFNDGITAGGEFYFTMAFVEGESLEDVLRRRETLDPLEVAQIVRQVVSVLDYAHARGVVHRDLKPSNVLLIEREGEEPLVKVLDFGIAKLLHREGELRHAMTMQTQMPIGTPHYMAPEQVRGEEIDGRTDYYALGIMIYRMVSGRHPFEGKTMMEILAARLQQEPTPLAGVDAPAWMRGLVKDLLARDKERRPSSDQIALVLSGVLEEQRETRRDLRKVGAVVGVLAVVVALLAWQALTGSGSEPDPVDETVGEQPDTAFMASTGSDGESAVEPEQTQDPTTNAEPDPPPISEPAPAPLPVEVELESPAEGVWLREPRVVVAGHARNADGFVLVNGKRVAVQENGRFSDDVVLPEGESTVRVESSERVELAARTVHVDVSAPALELDLLPGIEVDEVMFVVDATISIHGRVDDGPFSTATLHCNGTAVDLDDEGRFELTRTVPDQDSLMLVLTATDRAGWRTDRYLTFRLYPPRDPDPPAQAEPAAELPRVPAGFRAVGNALGTNRWARRVEHAETGLVLVLVEGDESFYLGATEVSRDAYAVFLDRSGRAAPAETPFEQTGSHPVVNVTAADAEAFCKSFGLRLPAPEEWVYAARGVENLRYPWGEWEAGRCNAKGTDGDDAFDYTAPVGSLAKDSSWCAALDLGGNVSEWCAGGKLYGGAWTDGPAACKPAPKGFHPERANYIGFRVALSLEE